MFFAAILQIGFNMYFKGPSITALASLHEVDQWIGDQLSAHNVLLLVLEVCQDMCKLFSLYLGLNLYMEP